MLINRLLAQNGVWHMPPQNSPSPNSLKFGSDSFSGAGSAPPELETLPQTARMHDFGQVVAYYRVNPNFKGMGNVHAERIDFKIPTSIAEAFRILEVLTNNPEDWDPFQDTPQLLIDKTSSVEFANFAAAFENENLFSELKIVRFIGSGQFSKAFELSDGSILKLATRPNLRRQQIESFDAPRYGQGKLPIPPEAIQATQHHNDDGYVHWYRQAKGDRYGVTQEHVSQVRQMVINAGYVPSKDDFGPQQIALFEGNPLLIDPDCVYKPSSLRS